MHIYNQCINVKNHLGLAAKVSKEINNIPTSLKNFFPYLACISADYAFFLKSNVIRLSSPFRILLKTKNLCFETLFFPHLYSLFSELIKFFT